jgi:hypothetical protein
VPEHDARQGLDFDVAQRLALSNGERADLVLRELDISPLPNGEPVNARPDLAGTKPVRIPIEIIEASRERSDGRVAALLDLAQQILDSRGQCRIFGSVQSDACRL